MKFIKINLLIILIANIIIPSPINEQTAVTIGENFFYSKNIREDNGYSYSSVNLLNHNNEDIFYIINLEPSGFILVAADDLIMPILAFSFENNFKMDTFPTNIDYMFDLYTEELLTQKITNEQDNQIKCKYTKNWQKGRDQEKGKKDKSSNMMIKRSLRVSFPALLKKEL